MPSNWYHQVEVRILSPLKLCVNTYPISHDLLQLRGFSLLRFTAIAIFGNLLSRGPCVFWLQWRFVRETPRGPRLNSMIATESTIWCKAACPDEASLSLEALTLFALARLSQILRQQWETTMHDFCLLFFLFRIFHNPSHPFRSSHCSACFSQAPFTCACQNL